MSDYIVKTAALEEIPAAIANIKQRLESENMTWYRMLLVTPVRQGEKVRKFFLHAFHSFEYRALSLGNEEEGLVLTVNDSERTEEVFSCCEKMKAFCKNFLGETPQILCSRAYQQGDDSSLLYEQTKAYAKGKKCRADFDRAAECRRGRWDRYIVKACSDLYPESLHRAPDTGGYCRGGTCQLQLSESVLQIEGRREPV